jgi:hypothetical protein
MQNLPESTATGHPTRIGSWSRLDRPVRGALWWNHDSTIDLEIKETRDGGFGIWMVIEETGAYFDPEVLAHVLRVNGYTVTAP